MGGGLCVSEHAESLEVCVFPDGKVVLEVYNIRCLNFGFLDGNAM